jgi:hypothetical protein
VPVKIWAVPESVITFSEHKIMANTLTGLIPTIYQNLDIVSRELVGLIPAVSVNSDGSRAAVGQTIRIPVTATQGASSAFTPAMAFPSAAYQTISYVDMSITKSQFKAISWQGEEWRSITQPEGSGGRSILDRQLQQAFRELSNEIETDLAAEHIYFSRAYGAAGTTPFGTADDMTDFAEVRRILEDNGAPLSDMRLVLNSAAVAKIRGKQSGLFHVDSAGTDSMLRRGEIGAVNGMSIGQSAQIATHTAGTNSGATTNTAGYAVGATVITLASAGTGTILAGDVITFAGDTNKYVVASGDADVSGGGTITLAAPGLRKAIATSATLITTIATSARNMAFNRDAIQLIVRAPAMPMDGDMAIDSQMVTDPVSGISFDIRMYKGLGMNTMLIMAAWGVKTIKPEHTALLLG